MNSNDTDLVLSDKTDISTESVVDETHTHLLTNPAIGSDVTDEDLSKTNPGTSI